MQSFTITENDADQRLDKFLRKLFPNATRSLIYKLNRKGKIKVITCEGKKTKQDNEYKINVGEKVQIYLPDTEITLLSQKIEQNTTNIQTEKLLKKDIVFEDGDLLILNKNPSQNVHPGDHKTQEVSVIEQVHDYYAGKLDSLTFKPSLVHRIDRDTSGILMIAKKKGALTKLSADFKKHDTIKKTYFCIVVGKLSRNSGTIKKSIKRLDNPINEQKVQVDNSGQTAITHYKKIDEYCIETPEGKQICTSLEVVIETGRMHQIRVHLQSLGNPIIGDKIYGDKKLNGYFAKHFQITRQMLHAWKISFKHPIRNTQVNLEARLKEDMQNFMRKIKS